ncbi:MAG: SPFH domain-containing protein, partial [Acidimicrobiia bacterium]
MEWVAVVLVLSLLLYLRVTLTRVTIFEFEQGLKYKKGKFVGVVDAGRHWIYRPTTQVNRLDKRPRFVSIQGQDVLSADGVTLKVSLAAQFEILDANTAINQVQNYQEALYLTLQLALRETIGQAKIDDVLAQRDEFGQRITEIT